MNSQRRFYKLLIVLVVALLLGWSAIGLSPFRSGHVSVQTKKHPPVVERGERVRDDDEADGPGPTDPGGALRFRHLQMQDEKGEIPPDGLEKARRHVERMKRAQAERLKNLKQSSQETEPGALAAGIEPDSWTWLGPGNVGGRIRAISIDPNNANEILIGSVSGGIWRTTNGGASWFPVNDFLANLAVSTLAREPTNPGTIYAGTGEGFGNQDAIQGGGIFKSTDGGGTWSQLASTANANFFFVNRLAISPSGVILAATSQVRDVNNNVIATGGIWSSTNGGASWTNETTTPAFDVDFQPGDNNLAVAGGEGGTMFRQLTPSGAPTWAAATFTPVVAAQPVQPPPPAPRIRTFQRRVEVIYAPSLPGLVYASVNQHQGGGNYQGEIYRSTDGGQTFTRSHMGTNFFNGGGGNQGWYDNALWVNPLTPTDVIVGGIHLWRSTDGGISFTQISDGSMNSDGTPGSAHADHHAVVAHPGFNNNTNTTVFFGNDGGIYRTNDINAASLSSGWVELNNALGITQFYGAAGNAASGVIVGGTQDNGTLRFTGNSEGWTSTFGNDGGYCASDPTDANFFYGESQNLAVVRSTNGGVSATFISAGIADSGVAGATNFIAPLALDLNEPNTLLAGGISLWRSLNVKDANPTWTAIKNPIAGNIPISAIAISPANSNFFLVGHNDGSIFFTVGGRGPNPTGTWTRIDTAALPNRIVTRLVIDSTRSPHWLYATFGGFVGDNVWRSTNNGTTWTDITGTGATGLPNVPVRTLVYHPVNTNLLYVGTEIGIFTSTDGGANWESTQDGPANVSVDELFWMGGDLIAATHGRGLYRASGGVYVRCGPQPPFEDGSVVFPFNTVAEAVNATNKYRAVWIFAGTCTEPFATPITKRLEFRSLGGPATLRRP